ncbi:hypothetical protein BOTBODRAFT_222907 [Botryobasidium botryosum FD-172 SS1]|uniref:Uncharacterized protein n=1 Tax=Botryobasidium botryosum (strain FD-172 SS1) TaxID=930990 RepID=A0A067MYN2_BOTB1|nr:hypothetical protein BOTBODRAFT_222907 [Botryobasidium botryosum FD-172 SS1]
MADIPCEQSLLGLNLSLFWLDYTSNRESSAVSNNQLYKSIPLSSYTLTVLTRRVGFLPLDSVIYLYFIFLLHPLHLFHVYRGEA